MSDTLTVALAQLAPIWLNKRATRQKIADAMQDAATQGAQLVCFGETLLPGYPFWLDLTDGARFNSLRQKELFAHYLAEAVCIDAGDLAPLCTIARQLNLAVYLGCAERATDRAGHSIYCSLVYTGNRPGRTQYLLQSGLHRRNRDNSIRASKINADL